MRRDWDTRLLSLAAPGLLLLLRVQGSAPPGRGCVICGARAGGEEEGREQEPLAVNKGLLLAADHRPGGADWAAPGREGRAADALAGPGAKADSQRCLHPAGGRFHPV
ncbi:hypothetical protein NDU88_001223 [Pleurodeles waltl]|uniref:Uncharacterized protein n=1 Tax=Pleurodeles waltl TaxID=8319 RepID=A0AAV7WHQ1_PLEWA|nr:hypothetical protein NDU88_001223 [Pleurodeles waltl]